MGRPTTLQCSPPLLRSSKSAPPAAFLVSAAPLETQAFPHCLEPLVRTEPQGDQAQHLTHPASQNESSNRHHACRVHRDREVFQDTPDFLVTTVTQVSQDALVQTGYLETKVNPDPLDRLDLLGLLDLLVIRVEHLKRTLSLVHQEIQDHQDHGDLLEILECRAKMATQALREKRVGQDHQELLDLWDFQVQQDRVAKKGRQELPEPVSVRTLRSSWPM